MSAQPLPRQKLIDAAVAHAAAHGLSDTSLRQLASALGTSHRMLIHHFGSKEGLLVEVVKAVEQRQRAVLEELAGAADTTETDTGVRFWESLNNAEVAQHERLFFEVYGQALQGRAWAVPLLDGIVESWIEPMTAFFIAQGAAPTTARVDARLAVAVSRGLLLDVLASGERDEVDAAMRRFMQLLTANASRPH
jgi:AcrR family transcriptional regulator